MNMIRRLDEQEIAELRRRRGEGWTCAHLADTYGVSLRTVQRYLREQPQPRLVHRLRAVASRWAALYAYDLRPQELDALVAGVVHAVEVDHA